MSLGKQKIISRLSKIFYMGCENILRITVLFVFFAALFNTHYALNSRDELVVEGYVYEYGSHLPVSNALVIYFIVFKNAEQHVGHPIDYAYTDQNGHYRIVLNQVEQQMGSAATYDIDTIKQSYFMLVAYKEGYLRNYSLPNPYAPTYYSWTPGENHKVIAITIPRRLRAKELSVGDVTARYYYDYMEAAAQTYAEIINDYKNLLENKLGISLLNEKVILNFIMGNYTKIVGYANLGYTEPNQVYINWYPWLTDPKIIEMRKLLIAHELTHLFQSRLNKKGMLVTLSGPWFTEGMAVAVSYAVLKEEGLDGASFLQQAQNENVELPQGHDGYFKYVGSNYPKWGKLFSDIVTKYKKEGEDEWEFISRFMKLFEEYASNGCVCEDVDKAYFLSDYETILLLSYAACVNLTEPFMKEYGFPEQLLIEEKNAYLKFHALRMKLSSLSPSDEKYAEIKGLYDQGVALYMSYKYAEAEAKFAEALEKASGSDILVDPISLKCLVGAIKVKIKLLAALQKVLKQYDVFLDGEEVPSEKFQEPFNLPPGSHKIEVYFKGVKILEKAFTLTGGEKEINIKIPEHRLHISAPSGATVIVYLDRTPVEKIENVKGEVELILPEGEYTITVVSGGQRKTYRITLNKDVYLKAGAEEAKKECRLTIRVIDQNGKPVRAEVYVDGESYLASGELTLKLTPGIHSLKVSVLGVIVAEEEIRLEKEAETKTIKISFYTLQVSIKRPLFSTTRTCTLYIYSSGKLVQKTAITTQYQITLPRGTYTLMLKCGDETQTKTLTLTSNTSLKFEVQTLDQSILIIAGAALAAVAIVVILILVKRG